MIDLSHRDHDVQRHRESGIDRAGDEVRRKNGGVPAGDNGDGKIETDDAVYREHERCRQSRQQQIRNLMPLPVRCGVTPTQREKGIYFFLPELFCAIAHRGQIGYQPEIPKQQGDREIRTDCKDVPHERAAELRPQPHRVGIRKQPVKNPWPAQVKQGHQTSATYGKQGHRFRKPVDRSAPRLEEQKQDRRDKCARVSDSYPPDEIHNRVSPGDRNIDTPDADPFPKQPRDSDQKHHKQQERDDETHPPRPRRTLQWNVADCFGDRGVGLARGEQIRGITKGRYRRNQSGRFDFLIAHDDFNSGLRLRNFAR